MNDPLGQTAVLPLALGAAAIGLFHLAGGALRGGRLAAAGIAVAFLAAFVVIVGLPALPPPSSMGRLFWSAAAGLAFGLGLDWAGLDGHRATLSLGAWLAASLVWISLPALTGGGPDTLPAFGLLVAGAWVALTRIARRTDFGMKYGTPNIGDEIDLLVEADFPRRLI
ncbi:MAG: hypothetical protein K2Q10_13110 [Rhodospirillales bacterium]|nr:hypothetical protein [Rhodospirillales bacterium]